MSKQTMWHLSFLLAVCSLAASAPVRAQLSDAQIDTGEDAGPPLPIGLDASIGLPGLDASVIVDAAAPAADAARASDAGSGAAKDAGPPAPTSDDLQLPDQGCSLGSGPHAGSTASLLLALALLVRRRRA